MNKKGALYSFLHYTISTPKGAQGWSNGPYVYSNEITWCMGIYRPKSHPLSFTLHVKVSNNHLDLDLDLYDTLRTIYCFLRLSFNKAFTKCRNEPYVYSHEITWYMGIYRPKSHPLSFTLHFKVSNNHLDLDLD